MIRAVCGSALPRWNDKEWDHGQFKHLISIPPGCQSVIYDHYFDLEVVEISSPNMMQIFLNLSCTRTQHGAWSSPGRSHTSYYCRRQRYSIVSDSSFDDFKPTGDDFASELSGGIDGVFQEFLPLFALVFGTSLESAAPGGGGGLTATCVIQGDPPKWVSRESILYMFGFGHHALVFVWVSHNAFAEPCDSLTWK